MAKDYLTFASPLGTLEWVTIVGTGKKKYDPTNTLSDEPKNFQYTATIIMNKDEAEKVKVDLLKFWREFKPAGATKQTYEIVKEVMVPVLDAAGKPTLDEDGAKITKPNGKWSMIAKTGVLGWKDKPTVVETFRPNLDKYGKLVPLNLGDKEIGNGSTGVIHGKIGINAFGGNEGLMFYLNGIQLLKFVERTDSEEIAGADLGDGDLGDLDEIEGLDETNEDGPKV